MRPQGGLPPGRARERVLVVVIAALLAVVLAGGLMVLLMLKGRSPAPATLSTAATANPYGAIGGQKRPDVFRFDPQPDITAYELALALAPMFGGPDFVERMRPFYDAMPANAQRHWRPPTAPASAPMHEHEHR